ncbi:hypothetical protein BDV27DRAFT_152181 [Aspergillus caelatus]|uniref:Zn(2)-C6 fungal-type domain-containing protein n=1 Tax=Aspergillus caelatus TaxID=61420 RepID=A0A5N7AKF5_9EURO|nr:uncharacterized protein BDV27DRAFT_152181 [Aspergillus caelatus]KAE8370295.1 hypothetical protein BDV27DRAFT_152181 [Aspergillus caelatus]
MKRGKPSPACQTCRVRHCSCDRAQPVCSTCVQKGRECIPSYNIRFRKSRVDFVNQTVDHIGTYADFHSPLDLDANCPRSISSKLTLAPILSSPSLVPPLLGIPEAHFIQVSPEPLLVLPEIFVLAAEPPALYHEVACAPADRRRYATLLTHFRRHVRSLAARHLQRFADDDVDEAEHYHEKCIELLLPALNDLNDRTATCDGAILAASVLLRLYEEISEVQNENRPWQEGLGRGAFWIHQRQDMINAILNQRPNKADLTFCGLNRIPNDPNPETWAKRSTCASSIERCEALRHQLDCWDMHKPPCYAPFFHGDLSHRTGDAFPEITFTLDAAIVGVAYYHLSMLLMAIYNPQQLKIGLLHVKSRQQIEREVQFRVRALCGNALSNPCPPARVVACLAILQCGAWFTDPGEQRQLVDIINMVERDDM